MQETLNNNHSNELDDEIDFLELFSVLLKGKWIIFSLTTLLSIVGVIYSLFLPNIYESKSILVPVNSSNNISGALGSYSSLAGLAGISLPPAGEGNSVKAIQKISTLSFFENNILTNIFLPDLMAVKSWNSETNTVSYDKNIFETTSNTWIRNYSYPQQQIPSAQESYAKFKEHLNVSKDIKSGSIILSINHQSPFIAKQWTELIVDEINSYYRKKDKSEAERAVNYLNQQISKTGLTEVKQSIAELLQEETKKLTLIEANQYYVFDYIDPPAIMEKKTKPNRALICIICSLIGLMLSIVIVLIRHFVIKPKVT